MSRLPPLAEEDLSNRCEQCTDDRPFNLLEGGESTHLRGECHGGLLNTHFQMSGLPPFWQRRIYRTDASNALTIDLSICQKGASLITWKWSVRKNVAHVLEVITVKRWHCTNLGNLGKQEIRNPISYFSIWTIK